MTNSSVGFPQFYQIQQILDRFLDLQGLLSASFGLDKPDEEDLFSFQGVVNQLVI